MVQDTPQGQRGISGQGGEGAGTAVATSDIGDEGEIGQAAVPAYEDAGTRDDPDTGE